VISLVCAVVPGVIAILVSAIAAIGGCCPAEAAVIAAPAAMALSIFLTFGAVARSEFIDSFSTHGAPSAA